MSTDNRKQEVVKKVIGRPTILKEPVVRKLEEALREGANISQACKYAQISRQTFYENLHEKSEFLYRMHNARDYLKLKALKVVTGKIKQGDLKTSMWYLEKWDILDNPIREEELKEEERYGKIKEENEEQDLDKMENNAKMVLEAIEIIRNKETKNGKIIS